MHHIQKYILKQLTLHKELRYAEMRPPAVDSNLYSYHLMALQKDKLIHKTDKRYSLSPQGLTYAERISLDNFETRLQPKIITLLIIENGQGQYLLWPKSKQPFIGRWSLLSGKVHLDDVDLAATVRREAIEKFGTEPTRARHVGDCYIRTYIEEELVSAVLAHVWKLALPEGAAVSPRTRWVAKDELQALELAPGTELVLEQAAAPGGLTFAEYAVHTAL